MTYDENFGNQSNGLERKAQTKNITMEQYEKALENTMRFRKNKIEVAKDNYQIALNSYEDYYEDKKLHGNEIQYFQDEEGMANYKIVGGK